MISPRVRPPRKNPILRTRVPLLPPSGRSRAGLGLTAAAARGSFELQVCLSCRQVQYPPREICSNCLTSRLRWTEQDGLGELISDSVLHHSHEPYFRQRLPWRLGMVKLDAGPTVIVHLHGGCAPAPSRVRVIARLDRAGKGILLAVPTDEVANMADDPQLLEMTCSPKFRKVLVTDGKTETGQAIVRALIDAGADIVWVGYAEPWKKFPGFDDLKKLPQVELIPLDLTDSKSVSELGAELAVKVDILINNAEIHRNVGIVSASGIETAQLEMEVNYFGLLRLAQAFGPAMRGRAADGQSRAAAWVNVLSIFALSNFAAHGSYSASKAAARSLSQCLRAEMAPAGIRVVDIFPGPIEDEWNQTLPPPKVTPVALARAIINGLEEGVEEVYPGDVAQEWLERWRENSKILERELMG